MQDTAKYQVSSKGVLLKKLVFQVVRKKEASQHTEIACHREKCTTKETSFSSRNGKKGEGGREKPLENRRYSQFKFDSRNLKSVFNKGNYKN